MRFFEFQREARGETARLLLAFGITVLLLVVAVNAALALGGAGRTHDPRAPHRGR